MPIEFREHDIGCEPSPSVPAETVIQDGRHTFLLFFAVSREVGPDGFLADLGVAVVACRNCQATRFGYPNDEGLPEHPLHPHGLATADSAILEVVGSPWLDEVADEMARSARRIWGPPADAWIGRSEPPLRHFLVPLKEMTFECLAEGLVVERFCPDFPAALAYVTARLLGPDAPDPPGGTRP